jgi:hypothetical protein
VLPRKIENSGVTDGIIEDTATRKPSFSMKRQSEKLSAICDGSSWLRGYPRLAEMDVRREKTSVVLTINSTRWNS